MPESVSIQLVGTLTIPNTQQNSNVLTGDQYCMYSALMIFGPAALTNVCTVQTADQDVAAPNFDNVQSPPGTAVTVAAGAAVVLTAFPFPQIRIASAGAEGAARVFTVWGQRQVVNTR